MRLLARLVFLGFVGMTGFVTYNALYLQQIHSLAASRSGENDTAP
jgi:hypothetical protein